MTNGEKLCIDFPNMRYTISEHRVITTIGVAASFDLDWWNAEYKKPTTKNDLGVDCIRRSDIGLTDFEIVMCNGDYKETLKMLLDKIEKAPPVTPQEPRWILASERLPEEDTDVLVTLECGLIGIAQKKLADDDYGEPCYIWQDFEGEEHDVIAWMPLPEPFKAESEEEK